MTEAQPPPPNLHAELRRMGKLGRVREVQTYFGCLACDSKRSCPPHRGWPQGKRVPVRELMGLTSPWSDWLQAGTPHTTAACTILSA